MEFVLKSVIVLSFVLVAVFGFTIMMSGSAHCLVSLMEGGICPEGLLGFASFHIGFFKNVSSVASGNLGLLAASLAFGFLVIAASVLGQEFLFAVGFLSERYFGEPAVLVRKLRTWLSLLETSPTFSLSR